MLSTESYYLAWAIYLLAALGFLLVVRSWLVHVLSPASVVTILLLLAAWMLTPALPEAGADTYAPAVVVAAFDLLTLGFEEFIRALKPLVLMTGLALVVGVGFYLFQRRFPAVSGEPS
jgi:hypothetical protein